MQGWEPGEKRLQGEEAKGPSPTVHAAPSAPWEGFLHSLDKGQASVFYLVSQPGPNSTASQFPISVVLVSFS